MRLRALLPIAIVLAAPTFGAGLVRAEEPVVVAQAESLGEGEEPPDPAQPDMDAAEEPTLQKTPARAGTPGGIEEIIIRAGESEAVADYESADSVTGFDASDLEALGAQTVEDLATFTPNMEIVTSGSTTPTFFIRGVGLNDFNANSTGAVALYQDDVPVNSPALQLGTLFDMEAVNVLRGPQGTGPARNASAGAIKLYSRKPSGEYGAYLRSSFGNYNYLDFEGAVEAPIYEDILSSRFAFRFTQRDGFATNRCAGAPSEEDQFTLQGPGEEFDNVGYCGAKQASKNFLGDVVSPAIAPGLPSAVNDLGNWAARGTLLFQPTLDMEWTLGAKGSRRNEQSRLGQSIGYAGNFWCLDRDIESCFSDTNGQKPVFPLGSRVSQLLGFRDSFSYQDPDVTAMFDAAEASFFESTGPDFGFPDGCPRTGGGDPGKGCRRTARNDAKLANAEVLAKSLDINPYSGDYDKVGPTTNDTWGVYLRGDIALPKGLFLTTVTGYDTYDRFIDTDFDFSPNVAFEIAQDDEGWQATQDLRLSGQVSDAVPLRWDIGAFYLMESISAFILNDFGVNQAALVATRDYTQDLFSAAGYASLSWDFLESFTLDGGVRYNWDRKTIDYALVRSDKDAGEGITDFQERVWQAPTGTARLTYRFREDTHAYMKYTRGWKGGHFNATSSLREGVTSADPETIDAFETGLRGSWFQGRLGLDMSLFYYNYDDYQIFTIRNLFDAPPEFVVINASDAEVYGSEVDLVGRPFPGTFLNVRFSWLESQFLDFVQNQTIQESIGASSVIINKEINNSGNRLLNSPKFKVSMTAEQTVPLGRFGSVTARYDGAWTDVTFFDATEGRGIENVQGFLVFPENTIGQPAYWLHNLRVGYRPPVGNLEIAGFVRNLTDEVYRTFAFDAGGLNFSTIYFLGTPRTYGMNVTVNF